MCSSDSAFTNVDDVSGARIKPQAGYVLGIRAKDGDKLHSVEFQTGTVKRVCRSTLSAVANGLVAAAEAADYLRSVILAIVCPTMSLGQLMYSERKLLVQVHTDSKSVYDVVFKDTSRPDDK